MGGVTELFLVMLINATAAFAKKGNYIKKNKKKNGKPFGETEPHGDSPSFVNDLAESAIHFFKSRLAKK